LLPEPDTFSSVGGVMSVSVGLAIERHLLGAPIGTIDSPPNSTGGVDVTHFVSRQCGYDAFCFAPILVGK
jgi:hypothetical protein